MTTARGRGRPRGGGGERRDQILAAARARFARAGFAATSLREIAADAGVDAALISHHFGTKSALLAATLDLPFDPAERLAAVIDGDLEHLPERMVRTFVTSWDEHPEVFAAAFRSGDAAPVATIAREVVMTAIRDRLQGPDRDLRAALVTSQIMGLGLQRWVLRLEPVASAAVEDLVRVHAPAVDALVSGRPERSRG